MIQKPKGTYDVYGKQGKTVKELEKLLNALMENYNYEFIRTPHFESSELFHRGVGETTDIVSKETYDFKDRGDRDMTLRPEGTAGVVRSYIENKMYGDVIVPRKLWYYGPMYRYERPQSGRFREFYQFGVEVFGTNSPYMDAEVISIPVNFYRLLGLKDVKVHINTLGDQESRENYRNALLEYFKPYLNDLCEDCNSRYLKNPLRILDCKIDSNKDIMKNAPKIVDYLNEESKKHFEELKKALDALKIEYVIDSNLVRGLDYYTHTVFEVEANIGGREIALCGGGRYNHLVENLGGPSTPGVGFALGLERLLAVLEQENINIIENDKIDIYIIPMDTMDYSIALANDLRMNGFITEIDYMNRKIGNNFKQADRMNAKFIIIIGEEEKQTNILTIKNNHTKEEYKVDIKDLIDFLDENLDDCECEECSHE